MSKKASISPLWTTFNHFSISLNTMAKYCSNDIIRKFLLYVLLKAVIISLIQQVGSLLNRFIPTPKIVMNYIKY